MKFRTLFVRGPTEHLTNAQTILSDASQILTSSILSRIFALVYFFFLVRSAPFSILWIALLQCFSLRFPGTVPSFRVCGKNYASDVGNSENVRLRALLSFFSLISAISGLLKGNNLCHLHSLRVTYLLIFFSAGYAFKRYLLRPAFGFFACVLLFSVIIWDSSQWKHWWRRSFRAIADACPANRFVALSCRTPGGPRSNRIIFPLRLVLSFFLLS